MREKNISPERRKYLRSIFLRKMGVSLVQILLVVGFIVAWEILADLKIIDSFITSQPSRIWNTLMNLSSNDLLKHLGVTCFETLVGFVSGAFLGIIIAIILWWSDFLSKVFEPFLVVLNSLPKIALRTCYNNLGGSRYAGNYCNGTCYFAYRYYNGKLKWIYEHR